MHKILLFLITYLMAVAPSCSQKTHQESTDSGVFTHATDDSPEKKQPEVIVGADRMQEYLPLLTGRRVALMVNQTSRVGSSHLVDTLQSIGVDIRRIFAPEHGFRGDHSAGAHVKNSKDLKTGLPITSLYGSSRKPTDEMLADIDIVIFDIQDVGVRFYTYISSMHYMMEACAKNKKKFMVLDRPNPNGHYIDGPTLDLKFQSFIGMHPVPLVHGMTVGEFAKMINGKKWLQDSTSCELMVIPCLNYDHRTFYHLPVRPSPNLPTMASVYLYPTLGLFEGTNVSVGRGTDHPFELLGRPGLKEGSFEFTPKAIPGVADNPKYENKLCNGILLTEFAKTYILTNRRIYLDWLYLFYETNKEVDNGDFFLSSFNKLAGNDLLAKQISEGIPKEEVYLSWQEGIQRFRSIRKPYLLYPE